MATIQRITRKEFLSTPSARRATSIDTSGRDAPGNFYPRPPRGGRLVRVILPPFYNHFYPRPPRGGRHEAVTKQRAAYVFLSTPSARRATLHGTLRSMSVVSISIHALREEGDCSMRLIRKPGSDFYPRPPRGGRPSSALCSCCHALFLSTPSARRATLDNRGCFRRR